MLDSILALYQSTVIMTAPLLLTSLGGLITYHAGTINVAMEGLMLAGAFAGVVFSYLFSNAWMGILAAVVVSVLFSVVYSFFVTTLKTDNFAIGFALNIFISSFTLYLSRIMFVGQNAFNSPKIAAIPTLNFNFGVKALNVLFCNYSVLAYVSVILTFVISYLIYHMPFGLWLRAAGSFPDALKTAGKKVTTVQYIASIIAGALCGLAGAQLSLSNVVMFTKDMSGGRGFICLAIILISRGKPKTAFMLSVFFGLCEVLSIHFQSSYIPSQFLFMLPYIMAIVTLLFMNSSAIHKAFKGKETSQ